MIGIKTSGSFTNTLNFLNRNIRGDQYKALDRYGRAGVDALRSATPRETGETSQGWQYRVISERGRKGVEWYNTHVVNGTNIAIIIQYGHGTGTGGYVDGIDYINPVIKPIFEEMAAAVWREVTA